MFTILIAEDDKNQAKLMADVLLDEHYKVILTHDGEQALEALDKNHVDLLITDIMLPVLDGYSLTRQLRDAEYTLPILIVTALDTVKDKKKGFHVGTDDYMTKPVDTEEMVLRVKALLRRAKIAGEKKITIGAVTLNYETLLITRNEERITLPQKEFMLLYKLLSYPEIVFTRIQLMDEIWGMESDSDTHTVSVHISRLRDRFAKWPEFSIETVRGLGYRAVKNEG